MRRNTIGPLTGALLLILGLFLLLNPAKLHSATLYERYMVVNHNGQEILCEPYIVAGNDSVLKLFQQKGEISSRDFPDFLYLLQQVNPLIPDVNHIRPGEQILIPLKKLVPRSFPNQERGIVDIPFITITSIPDILKKHAQPHKVQKNDSISRLIARHYGPYGSRSYQEGIDIFQTLNPQISDLDKIYAGQELFLPKASLKSELYYSALFDSSGRLKQESLLDDLEAFKDKKAQGQASVSSLMESHNPYKIAASILNGRLMDSGVYFFPSENGTDVQLDLSLHPLIEKPNGEKILFVSNSMTEKEKAAVKNFWPAVTLNPVSANNPIETIMESLSLSKKSGEPSKDTLSFADMALMATLKARWIFETTDKANGETVKNAIFLIQSPSEKIPDTLCHYLNTKRIIVKDILQKGAAKGEPPAYFKKGYVAGENKTISTTDKKSFINDLVIALDLYYAQNIRISFPYSGIQITAFASLISTGEGQELLVDFENIYGDAFDAIKASGFTIISVKKMARATTVIKQILTSLDIPYKESPLFKGAERSAMKENLFLQIKGGYYIERKNHRKYLLLLNPIPEPIVRFLQESGIDIISIQA
jgi:LysM repeat protein